MPVGLLDQHHQTISRYPVALLGPRICSLLFQCSSQLFTVFVHHVGYGSYRPGERWILARLFAHMNTCGRRTTWADGSPTGDLDILSVRPSIELLTHAAFMYFDIF